MIPWNLYNAEAGIWDSWTNLRRLYHAQITYHETVPDWARWLDVPGVAVDQ